MTHYNSTQTFTFDNKAVDENITVFANGGSVDLEVQVSQAQWVRPDNLSLPYTTNVSEIISVAGKTIRITPADGAEYNFGQGI